jgi:hypothetical protein
VAAVVRPGVVTSSGSFCSSAPYWCSRSQAGRHSPVAFLYFSFVTLTTVGFGDLTPADGSGRMLAVVEALVGQLYLVSVVVANIGRGSWRARRDD